MDDYFDNYIGFQNNNDMNQRAFNFSRILKCLSQLHTLDTYVVDGKNLVDIDNICSVEYEITNKYYVIQNIYFNNY